MDEVMTKRTLLVGALVVFLVIGFCGPRFGDDIGPVPPTGLALIVGVSWVDLSWDASTEPDLAETDGYRLYRREIPVVEEGGEADVPEFPVDYNLIATGMGTWFHDMTVQSGVMYGYVITVKDKTESESAPSDEVDTVVPVYGPGEGAGGGGCFLSTGR